MNYTQESGDADACPSWFHVDGWTCDRVLWTVAYKSACGSYWDDIV